MQTTVEVPTKTAQSSLTLWLNILTVAIVVLGVIADNAQVLDLPAAALGYVAVANAALNALLRIYKTALPIGPEGSSKSVTVDLPKTAG